MTVAPLKTDIPDVPVSIDLGIVTRPGPDGPAAPPIHTGSIAFSSPVGQSQHFLSADVFRKLADMLPEQMLRLADELDKLNKPTSGLYVPAHPRGLITPS